MKQEEIEDLQRTREALSGRLAWLGVVSTGSERLKAQIEQLDREIEQKASQTA